ncbi:hypothetical protein ANO11243_047590 [Dothideomycetidae sp. 11243]|nr:hypothetical protein ANO11243_047590 [fungal sp. No.11243]
MFPATPMMEHVTAEAAQIELGSNQGCPPSINRIKLSPEAQERRSPIAVAARAGDGLGAPVGTDGN